MAHAANMDDGVRLAVRESGPEGAPVVVCVHGFPDSSRLWDGVVNELEADFRVVVYDVRGAGESDRPKRTADYRLDRLGKDLLEVVAAVGGDVHLLAHDWGSIQAWHALGMGLKVKSYTTISGPGLDQAGAWVKAQARQPRRWGAMLRQLLSSWYLLYFQIPGAAELTSRTGLMQAIVGHRIEHRDVKYGLKLYRAGMLRRLARPRPSKIEVPVQVLVPTQDRWVKEQVQLVPGAAVHRAKRGHWLPLEDPRFVAQRVREFARG